EELTRSSERGKLAAFLAGHGEALLPMVSLIEGAEMAVDELVDVLGLRDREGASENTAVAAALLEDLVERGVRAGRRRPSSPPRGTSAGSMVTRTCGCSRPSSMNPALMLERKSFRVVLILAATSDFQLNSGHPQILSKFLGWIPDK
ncbi:hypothetical protein ACFLQ0_05365, partial [Nitrospinota bacterium]